MKKLFLLFCTLLAIGIACPGCNDGKDNGNGSPLVGTWRSTFSTGYIQYVFNADGLGSMYEVDYEDAGDPPRQYVFTYRLQGEVLTFTYTDFDGPEDIEQYTIRKIGKDEIHWIDPDGYSEILYRVK